jgi:hypothetical protein
MANAGCSVKLPGDGAYVTPWLAVSRVSDTPARGIETGKDVDAWPGQEGDSVSAIETASSTPDYSAKSEMEVAAMAVFNGDESRFSAKAGVVTDKLLGILWQQGDSGKGFNWVGSKTYCTNLVLNGLVGWRVPTIAELLSTMDKAQSVGHKISTVFEIGNSTYWSGTPVLGSSTDVFDVDFTHGLVLSQYFNSTGGVVRCAR